jgi:hypothetical protein
MFLNLDNLADSTIIIKWGEQTSELMVEALRLYDSPSKEFYRLSS